MKGENKKQKGALFGLPFFMIIGLIVVVSAWLFFIFFKVHITSIAVDVDSINRYQEVPTTLLGASVRARTLSESSTIIEESCKPEDQSTPRCQNLAKLARDLKEAIQGWTSQQTTGVQLTATGNCFNGDGPAGPHSPNDGLCTKRLAFYYTKLFNGAGDPVFLVNPNIEVSPDLRDLVSNMRAALPRTCYRISFGDATGSEDGEKDKLESSGINCDIKNFPKLKETYPMPIFLGGVPTIAAQTLTIGSSSSQGQEIFISWPRYDTCFSGQTGCEDKGGETEVPQAAADNLPEIEVSHTPPAPAPTETVSLDATVSDDIELKTVEIFLDGGSLGSCHYVGTKSGVCTRTTTSYPEGTSHEYYAKVTDSGDQVSASDKKTFTVGPEATG